METEAMALARKVRDRLARRGVRGWEVYVSGGRGGSYDWAGDLENLHVSRGYGVGLRLLRDGRMGFSYGNDFSETGLDRLIDRAEAIRRAAAPDPHYRLADPAPVDEARVCDDPEIFRHSEKEKLEILRAAEKEAKSHPAISKLLRATYAEGRGEAAILNEKGLERQTAGTSVSLAVYCIAQKDGETQVSGEGRAWRYWEDMRPDQVVREAIRRSTGLLGARPLPSGEYPILLEPAAAADFLDLIGSALCADAILKNESPFVGRKGEKVGADCVTITDDGGRQRGMGTSPFDDEGLPTGRTVLLRNGVVEGFLHDLYTSARSGEKPTGNAGRGSAGSPPSPDTTNLCLEPGTEEPEKLLADISDGVWVQDLLGMHNADPVSGDFSVGILGYRIRRGRRQEPVRGATLAGNLLDLLAKVERVGSDLTWYGSTGAPTVVLLPMPVSSS